MIQGENITLRAKLQKAYGRRANKEARDNAVDALRIEKLKNTVEPELNWTALQDQEKEDTADKKKA